MHANTLRTVQSTQKQKFVHMFIIVTVFNGLNNLFCIWKHTCDSSPCNLSARVISTLFVKYRASRMFFWNFWNCDSSVSLESVPGYDSWKWLKSPLSSILMKVGDILSMLACMRAYVGISDWHQRYLKLLRNRLDFKVEVHIEHSSNPVKRYVWLHFLYSIRMLVVKLKFMR